MNTNMCLNGFQKPIQFPHSFIFAFLILYYFHFPSLPTQLFQRFFFYFPKTLHFHFPNFPFLLSQLFIFTSLPFSFSFSQVLILSPAGGMKLYPKLRGDLHCRLRCALSELRENEYGPFHHIVLGMNWWPFWRTESIQLPLTLVLLVANLANSKWCKKLEKWLKHWHMDTHLRVINESYPMIANMTGFKWFLENFAFKIVLWQKLLQH